MKQSVSHWALQPQIIVLVTVVLLAIAGWLGWGRYQAGQSIDASASFAQLKACAGSVRVACVAGLRASLY